MCGAIGEANVAVRMRCTKEYECFRGNLSLVNDFESEMIGSAGRMQVYGVISIRLQQAGWNNDLYNRPTVAPSAPEEILNY